MVYFTEPTVHNILGEYNLNSLYFADGSIHQVDVKNLKYGSVELGSGSFGSVYKIIGPNNQKIAAKYRVFTERSTISFSSYSSKMHQNRFEFFLEPSKLAKVLCGIGIIKKFAYFRFRVEFFRYVFF